MGLIGIVSPELCPRNCVGVPGIVLPELCWCPRNCVAGIVLCPRNCAVTVTQRIPRNMNFAPSLNSLFDYEFRHDVSAGG